MSISPGYKTFIQDQLALVPELSIKSMFGGLGFYSAGVIFGVADNDSLYFKVDDRTRPLYQEKGMPGWDPMGTGASMGYFQVPPDVVEDPAKLASWAAEAVVVSNAKKTKKSKK